MQRRDVNKLLEDMRKDLAKSFGVTLQEDESGKWGPIGARYLTLRLTDKEHGLVEVHMQILNVTGDEDYHIDIEQ